MRSQVAMLGSRYLETSLHKTWPFFTPRECLLCGKKFRREWLWRFTPRRKYALERPETKHACHRCTSSNYNEAVEVLDAHYRDVELQRARHHPYQY